MFACAAAGLLLCPVPPAIAQPAGTPPPSDVFESPQAADDKDSLPIRAFMFMTESDNPVMVPGLTWEELQRLIDLDQGGETQPERHAYQSLEITGTATGNRAELEVVLRVTAEPTQGRWSSIPLGMANFHLLAPPDVSGADEYSTRLMPDGTGYQLVVKTDREQQISLRMRLAARVETSSVAKSLQFRLPDVPTRVEFTTDAARVSGEVVGRGDETLVRASAAGNPAKFIVESSGGNFALRWGDLASAAGNPLLEAESRVLVRWPSPQDEPIASVRTSIESLGGSIHSFQIQLPPAAVLLRPPQLGASGQTIEWGKAVKHPEGMIHDVSIPEQERGKRIDLVFDLQLTGPTASQRTPLILRVPEVVGALRHHGELEVRTGADYRLRWRGKSWIRSEPHSDDNAQAADRTYKFAFDRAGAELPIWLGKKESQVRMISESTITITESLASLDMTIRAGGQLSGGNLQLDEASWQLDSIENLETEQPLDSDLSGFVRVIELGADSETDPVPVRIRARYKLDPDEERVELPLPRVVDLGDQSLVQNATVNLVSSGRSVFVLDLAATKDLRRIAAPISESEPDSFVGHYQVLNLDMPVVIVGNLVEQPPQITLSSNAHVELDGQQVRTKIDWTISSRTDLEGRLPIRIPYPAVFKSADQNDVTAIDEDDVQGGLFGVRWDRIDLRAAATRLPWMVTVDDVPAALRPLGGDRYDLISDQLTDGTMAIGWQHVMDVEPLAEAGTIGSLSLPRPNVADLTIRGTIDLLFEGDQRFDLFAADNPGTVELNLETVPRDPLQLRVKSRTDLMNELSLRQTLLRTVVGMRTRHEQLLANVHGGDQLRIAIDHATDDLSVEGYIDAEPASVRRDGDDLLMNLPADNQTHVVDLRVWIPLETPSSLAIVKPMLKIPFGSGRVFWQIIAPRGGHVVWATPTLGRSMWWQLDRWQLFRTPTYSNAQLTAMVPSVPNDLPDGNVYLYAGADVPSFRVVLVSNVLLWLTVGLLVLVSTALLTHVPKLQHPLTVVFGAFLFVGAVVVAPDAAVLAGQLILVSLVLVTVLITIRNLWKPSPRNRVFPSSVESDGSNGQPQVLSPQATPSSTRRLPASPPMAPSAPTEAPS